ncbi:VC2046/SO_2500 family protein [Colwellia ponticola]|uniref:VC2046/SO_2500 family protein n=1 Tax=Colwellia ponticola TaxID=2304625 RepID=UPI001FE78DBF|nr:VC2046/SO_2500 family protein [Colwellia ponticola]
MPAGLSQPFSATNLSQRISQSNSVDAANNSAGQLAADFSSSTALLHELQLGEQLNESVVQSRRADFSLMLAMLAEDVREQSQFLLPQAQQKLPADVTNRSLRKQFNLPEEASLALSTLDELSQFNQVQAIVDNSLATLQLTNAMQPRPLAFRDDKKHINSNVLHNTSLFTQLKYKQAALINQELDRLLQAREEAEMVIKSDKPLSKPLTFNATAWLDNIQQSIIQAPLVS